MDFDINNNAFCWLHENTRENEEVAENVLRLLSSAANRLIRRRQQNGTTCTLIIQGDSFNALHRFIRSVLDVKIFNLFHNSRNLEHYTTHVVETSDFFPFFI